MKAVEKFLRVVLSEIPGVGSRSFLDILEKYGSAEQFFNDKHNSTIRGVDLQNIKKTIEKQPLESCVVYGEVDYPFLLSQIYDPPPVIYFKGNKSLLNSLFKISIVGTRHQSLYGMEITKAFVQKLVEHDFTIVSGLANGIDSIVHQTVTSSLGKTIAVLGVNINHPEQLNNPSLCNEIISHNGLILSEYYDKPLHKGNFPRRNRIIAGLSQATLVIEAPARSGALITANLAFDYNREVFAVPGSILLANQIGTNNLIKYQKARLVNNIHDILDFYMPGWQNNKLSKIEGEILNLIKKYKKIAVDEILILIDSINLEVLLGILSSLELKNLVAKVQSGHYTLRDYF